MVIIDLILWLILALSKRWRYTIENIIWCFITQFFVIAIHDNNVMLTIGFLPVMFKSIT